MAKLTLLVLCGPLTNRGCYCCLGDDQTPLPSDSEQHILNAAQIEDLPHSDEEVEIVDDYDKVTLVGT